MKANDPTLEIAFAKWLGGYRPGDELWSPLDQTALDCFVSEYIRVNLNITSHPDDQAVDRFARAMKLKLAFSREKGRGGWDDPARCRSHQLAQMLIDHVDKGDPVDVANFAMMIHQRDAQGIESMHIANNGKGVTILGLEGRQPRPCCEQYDGYTCAENCAALIETLRERLAANQAGAAS